MGEGEGAPPASPAVVRLLAEFVVGPAVLVLLVALSLDAPALPVGASRFGFVLLIRWEGGKRKKKNPKSVIFTKNFLLPGRQVWAQSASGLAAAMTPRN